MVAAGSDDQFKILARALGAEGAASDPRFITRPQRVIHLTELTEWIDSILKKRSRAHWLEKFLEVGLMAAPINSIAEAFSDPHVRHRGMVVEVQHPRAGKVPLVTNPIRYAKTKIPVPTAPPTVGEHTNEVLSSVLGLSRRQIDALRESGAV